MLLGMMLFSIIVASSSSFQQQTPPCSPLHQYRHRHQYRQSSSSSNKKKKSSCSTATSPLAYAGTSTPSDDIIGPMTQVDPNAKSGGCPFLVKSHDAHKTYAVPALFFPASSSATTTEGTTTATTTAKEEDDVDEDEQRPIVLFDGSCNLCNNFVQFLLKYDTSGSLRFAALQSKVGELLVRRMPDDVRKEVLHVQQQQLAVSSGHTAARYGEDETKKYKSIVLCTPDTTYIQSSAVLKILASLSSSSSKRRIKLLQYLSLAGYILPTKLRDRVYKFVSKRRKSWFGEADECMLYDDRFDDRFVDDGVLTGVFRDDPSLFFAANNHHPNNIGDENNNNNDDDDDDGVVVNLFKGENPPQRGDTVQIIWPQHSTLDPSVTYDDEFPHGLCLVGGKGTITNVDLPMRVVLRVDRKSIGLGNTDDMGEETMIAWVKPTEVAFFGV